MRKIGYLLVVASMALVGSFYATNTAHAVEVLGPNLIQNPSFESGVNGAPTGWNKDRWSNNAGAFNHPVIGVNAGKAAQVTVTSYTSGDAKWYFQDVPVTAGKVYQFSDYSLSNANSVITLRYKMSNNSYSYVYLASVTSSASFKKNTYKITVPANAVAVTAFHLLGEVGSLTTDEYALNEITDSVVPPVPPVPPTPTTTPSTNLIINGDLETVNSNGQPLEWNHDHWNDNVATWDYPVTGVNNSKAVRVNISSYNNGDAKWFAEQVVVTPGKIYTYTDNYKSAQQTSIVIKYEITPGNYTFEYIKAVPASTDWATSTFQFTVPTGKQKVTIYHLLTSVGSLTLDNAVLLLTN